MSRLIEIPDRNNPFDAIAEATNLTIGADSHNYGMVISPPDGKVRLEIFRDGDGLWHRGAPTGIQLSITQPDDYKRIRRRVMYKVQGDRTLLDVEALLEKYVDLHALYMRHAEQREKTKAAAMADAAEHAELCRRTGLSPYNVAKRGSQWLLQLRGLTTEQVEVVAMLLGYKGEE